LENAILRIGIRERVGRICGTGCGARGTIKREGSFLFLPQFSFIEIKKLPLPQFMLANVQVARASDFGKNDTTLFTRTHLGHILQPGDSAMGF